MLAQGNGERMIFKVRMEQIMGNGFAGCFAEEEESGEMATCLQVAV